MDWLLCITQLSTDKNADFIHVKPHCDLMRTVETCHHLGVVARRPS